MTIDPLTRPRQTGEQRIFVGDEDVEDAAVLHHAAIAHDGAARAVTRLGLDLVAVDRKAPINL